MDSLADTCASAGHGLRALDYYNDILERLRDQDDEAKLEEATVLFKMSKIHKQANERESQMAKLHFALKMLAMEDSITDERKRLEHEIQVDIRSVRLEMEREELDWV